MHLACADRRRQGGTVLWKSKVGAAETLIVYLAVAISGDRFLDIQGRCSNRWRVTAAGGALWKSKGDAATEARLKHN